VFTVKEVIPYIRNTYGDVLRPARVSFRDYSLHVNKGVLYITYKLENYKIGSTVMECNLCSDVYKWEEFRIDVPMHRTTMRQANAKMIPVKRIKSDDSLQIKNVCSPVES